MRFGRFSRFRRIRSHHRFWMACAKRFAWVVAEAVLGVLGGEMPFVMTGIDVGPELHRVCAARALTRIGDDGEQRIVI